ncbi:ornithine racemase Orr [Geosporobacter ferrireducens]|uniref:Alanine racemase n=1 Tax=Geosporobacter ferrireducens TaxID=1424294 RepID=A0A1D8GPL2_9FIRM|nr:ornithine racemase Orr [Geosporobacter ferrireducens]AOT72843.1 alanine racemase [Geosporobacter ferrireducens]MTI55242.1 alanine/ornithine racemase family PLP-dependent enzyme [Geosporobacter ferrireducens]
MNNCPRIEIDLSKIRTNTKILTDRCKKAGIQVAGVTKGFCAVPQIAEALVEGGIAMLADSRLENFDKIAHIPLPKILLRLPMISQVEKVVSLVDISLNSELSTIKKLSEESLKQKKIHKIILMIDLGDLREGIWNNQVIETIEEIVNLDGIKLIGVGTNLTCYGGVIPTKNNLGLLADFAKEILEKFQIQLEIISGGNSSSLYLLDREEMPKSINHLRLGESIVLGRETAFGEAIPGTYQDAFRLVAEIIELKEKPSVPIGEIGMDAFGNKPVFEDRGIRKRAILAVGRQDVSVNNLIPKDEKISILGASSDHLIIDVTDSSKEYAVGDEVSFNIEYGALLQLMTSEYVYKRII